MRGSCGYPKTARIRRRREYLSIQRDGRRRHTAHFVVIRRAGQVGSRLGVTVSSRVGNAVVRNRLKRLVREVFRLRRAELAAPTELVVIAKPGADQLTYGAVATELERALDLSPRR